MFVGKETFLSSGGQRPGEKEDSCPWTSSEDSAGPWGFLKGERGKQIDCSCSRSPQFDSWVSSSPGEGIDYPLQDSWASLVAQTIKNLPAMQDTWVLCLFWEYPLEESMATNSCLEIPHGQRSLAGYSQWGCKVPDTTEWKSTRAAQLFGEEGRVSSFTVCRLSSAWLVMR